MTGDYLKRDMRDPLIVLLEREAATCAGCVHRGKLWGMFICTKHDRAALTKCKSYKEKA